MNGRRSGPTRRSGAAGALGAGLLATAAGAGHVLYPATLWWLTRNRPRQGRRTITDWPGVTVLVAAYRESGVIGAKVADVEANGYQGDLEVIVVAEDAETADRARAAGARVIEPPERLGKAQALNVGMRAARHPVVVISDANNSLGHGSIASLVQRMEDPRVGAVAGRKIEADGGGEELYWRFESWVNDRAARLGTTIGIAGELVAVRADAWCDIPEDVSSDDLWLALDLAERGFSVAYEPSARSIEPPVESGEHQWERRTRISSGALYVFWRKRALLRPGHGVVTLEIIGHKLWRSTVGPLAHLTLLGWAAVRARHSPVAALLLAGHAVGAGAAVHRQRGGRVPKLLAAPAQVLYLQAVAIGGMVRFLRGDRVLKWTKAHR